MALNLKKLAQEATTLAEIMEGRDKLDTEDIIAKFPKGISIDEAEYVTIQKTVGSGDDAKTQTDEFWAFHFVESPNTFSFGGFILAKIFNSLLTACEGDFTQLKYELSANPLKVRLHMGKTKSKQNIALVDIL